MFAAAAADADNTDEEMKGAELDGRPPARDEEEEEEEEERGDAAGDAPLEAAPARRRPEGADESSSTAGPPRVPDIWSAICHPEATSTVLTVWSAWYTCSRLLEGRADEFTTRAPPRPPVARAAASVALSAREDGSDDDDDDNDDDAAGEELDLGAVEDGAADV